VDKLLNSSLDQMENAVIRLKNRLSTSRGAYGFFFYAGHGVQSGGENYLLPVDANIPSESYLRQRAISVQTTLDELNQAGNELNIVVLDACRDNPFSWRRSGARGLAMVSYQPADSIIVYATSAGSTAADGSGRNGLFTGQLLNNLKTPGIDVNEVFRLTMSDVARVSGNIQRPAIYNQFAGIAYLGLKPPEPPTAIPAETAQTAAITLPVTGMPSPMPERSRTEKPGREPAEAARLWSAGVSVGSAFTTPLLIATLRGTLAPLRNSFLELGFDAGFLSGTADVQYYSFYPFVHLAFFMPLSERTGWYAGAGGGYLMAKYSFPKGDIPVTLFPVDFIAGINLFDMLDISYTFRTDFKNADNKASVGYTYRFR
jgi:hypothetical protein